MKMPLKRWVVLPLAPADFLASRRDLHPVLLHALYHRGLRTPDEIEKFLAARLDATDPFRLLGIAESVTHIRQAIKEQALICVYGDFDADGVAGCALLVQTLNALGAKVTPYIPHRVDEGYGLNIQAMDRLAAQGLKLIITVDCGIRSSLEVAHANRLGMEVIVTDHHAPPAELPSAKAVINPRLPNSNYPERNLCGVGVAFKLAQALLRVETQVPSRGDVEVQVKEEDLLDLVALGTVTDLAPLTGENRALVMQGLAQLRQGKEIKRPGLRELIATARLRPEEIDTHAIGYILGPRLNAAGRMGDATLAYRLLSTSSESEAQSLAQELENKNRARQLLLDEVWGRAREQVLPRSREPLLWAIGPDLKSGVIGLAAARLVEEFYRPAIAVERGEKESRGSCRSIPEFNITLALDECQDLLRKYGGHSTAAGFTVDNQNLPALENRLRQIASQGLAGLQLLPSLTIDAQIPLKTLHPDIFFAARRLEPLGVANPPLTLLSRGVEMREKKQVGEDHLKLILTDGRIVWDAMAFGQGRGAGDMPRHIDLVYSPEIDHWDGMERFRLNVLDFRPATLT